MSLPLLYKLVLGAADRLRQVDQYVRTGPSWPNTSSHLVPLAHFKRCDRAAEHGCLFELGGDPYELHNLAAAMPDRFNAMLGRIDELQATVYSPDRGKEDPRACAVAKANGGYWGPFE